jgi:hypothetical protein
MLLLVFAPNSDFEIDQEAARIIEMKVFWTLVALIERLPKETYGDALSGAILTQEVLWKWIIGSKASQFGLEKVAEKIRDMSGKTSSDSQSMPPMASITLQWYLTLFIQVFPFDVVLRLWDLLIYQPGEKVFMRVILTLLKINEDKVI